MPRVIRTFPAVDLSQGHEWTPTPLLPPILPRTVFAELFPIAAVGDDYNTETHISPTKPKHQIMKALVGSPNVFVNGLPVHRDGDLISCGDVADNGARTVFANGGGLGGPAARDDAGETTGYIQNPAFISYPVIQVYYRVDNRGNFIEGCKLDRIGPDAYTPLEEEDSKRMFKNYPGPPITRLSGGQNLPDFATKEARDPIPFIAINGAYFLEIGINGIPLGLKLDPITGEIYGALLVPYPEVFTGVRIHCSNRIGEGIANVTFKINSTLLCA